MNPFTGQQTETGAQAVLDGDEVLLVGDLWDYLHGPPRYLSRLAALDHAEVHEQADALLAGEGTEQDRHLVRQALCWLGDRYTTASKAVREVVSSSPDAGVTNQAGYEPTNYYCSYSITITQ